MSEIPWISVRNGKIVGTPFGPEVTDGQYLLVDNLVSEGGDTPEVVEFICQSLIDYRRQQPLEEATRDRRIKWAEKVLRTMLAASLGHSDSQQGECAEDARAELDAVKETEK